MATLTKLLASVCVILTFWLWFVTSRYVGLKDNYSVLKDKFNEQATITKDYEKHINSLHKLGTQHTTEFTNAKAEIDKLRDDVRSGSKRVHVKADCPKPESDPTSAWMMADPPHWRETLNRIVSISLNSLKHSKDNISV